MLGCHAVNLLTSCSYGVSCDHRQLRSRHSHVALSQATGRRPGGNLVWMLKEREKITAAASLVCLISPEIESLSAWSLI